MYLEAVAVLFLGITIVRVESSEGRHRKFAEERSSLSGDRVARPLVAFSVARKKAIKGHKQIQASLSFDHVFYNEGQHFNLDSGIFTVPKDGVYEFTFSGSALPHKKLSLMLIKNHFEVQALAYDGHRKKNPHVQSQNIILQLQAEDRIWLMLAASKKYGVVGEMGGAYVTTFTGRLLEDTTRQHSRLDVVQLSPFTSTEERGFGREDVRLSRSKRLTAVTRQQSNYIVAFSVAKTTSVIGHNNNNNNQTRHEPSYEGKLSYDKVFVNAGDGINKTSGEFIAPISGLYHFSYTVGKYPKKKLSVALMKNNNEFQVIVYDESRSDKRQMQSQTVILQLEAGDRVWLNSYNAEGYAVYSNLGNYITFNGYLLQALL